MSIMSREERAVVQARTHISPFIVDRCCDAFDAILRDDREMYVHNIMTAIAQLGLPMPIPEHEKPTAVDRMKSILMVKLADEWHVSFPTTIERIRLMLDR
jgi:hypothetical protein